MPCVGGQGAEFAAEDSVVMVAALKVTRRPLPKSPRYIPSVTMTASSNVSVGNTKPRARVPGASKAYMTLGGKKSMERLREFEWL